MALIKYDFKPLGLVDGKRPRGAKKSKLLKEVCEFVISKVEQRVAGGNSPLEGGGKFPILNKEYAANKKGGNRNPNLRLSSKMLDSLNCFIKKDGNTLRLTVGKAQNDKADGHCNFSGNSSLPERRFIPNEADGETFREQIINGIRSIVNKK